MREQGTGNREQGQSLTELVIVMAVAIVIVGALVLTTIATLRNAQFSQNQAQATKLAQEGIERAKIGRDRAPGTTITGLTLAGAAITSWQTPQLWDRRIIDSCNPCYFTISSSGNLNWIAAPSSGEAIPPSPGVKVFNRVILISDAVPTDVTDFTKEKKVTSIVSWMDFAGSHESRLTTVLRKI